MLLPFCISEGDGLFSHPLNLRINFSYTNAGSQLFREGVDVNSGLHGSAAGTAAKETSLQPLALFSWMFIVCIQVYDALWISFV